MSRVGRLLVRIFGNNKDCELYKMSTHSDARVDVEAYTYIENEVLWSGFKKYLKEQYNLDYTRESGLDQVQLAQRYIGDYQAGIDHYVVFEGRFLYWIVKDMFLEPEVWELENGELSRALNQLKSLHCMSLFRLIWWYFNKPT